MRMPQPSHARHTAPPSSRRPPGRSGSASRISGQPNKRQGASSTPPGAFLLAHDIHTEPHDIHTPEPSSSTPHGCAARASHHAAHPTGRARPGRVANPRPCPLTPSLAQLANTPIVVALALACAARRHANSGGACSCKDGATLLPLGAEARTLQASWRRLWGCACQEVRR